MPPKKSSSAAAATTATSSADASGAGPKRRARIQPIKDDRTRAVTLLKRRAGVFKKAFELSVLCQCDIGVIIFAPNGKLFEFSSAGDMDDILLRYTEYLKPHEVKTNQDFVEGGDGQVGAPVQGESDDEGDTSSVPAPPAAAALAAAAPASVPQLQHPSQMQQVSQRPLDAQPFGQPAPHSFVSDQAPAVAHNSHHHAAYDAHQQQQQQPFVTRVRSQSSHQAGYSQSPPQLMNNPQVPTGVAPAYQQVAPPLHSAGQFAPSEYHQPQHGTPYLAPIASPPTATAALQHSQQQPLADPASYHEQQYHPQHDHGQQHHNSTAFPPPSVHDATGQPGVGPAASDANGTSYDLFTSFHTASPQTYLPPLTSARPEFAPQNSLLAAAITAPSSSSQRRGSTDSRSRLTLHQDSMTSNGIDPDLPTPILTPPSNNSKVSGDSTRPPTKRDRDAAAASDNDRPQLAPIDVLTSPTNASDHTLPSPSNGPPTKRSKPNFARKTPFSLKLQIPGSSTPSTSSHNPNSTTSSTGGSRTGRESASASPSMACPPADGRGPVLLEPNPSSAGAGGPGSSPVTRSPMVATPGGSHINPFTGAPLRTSNGGGGPTSAHPASAFPLFSASTPNPGGGGAGGYGGTGGQPTRKSPFMHFKGTNNSAGNVPVSSAYPAPISASAIPSPSGFFADRLPLPPTSRVSGGSGGNRPASSPVFPSPIPPIHGGYSTAFGTNSHQHQHPLSRMTAGGDTPNSDNGGGSSPAEVKRELGAPYPRPVAAAAGRTVQEYEMSGGEWKREHGVGHAVE